MYSCMYRFHACVCSLASQSHGTHIMIRCLLQSEPWKREFMLGKAQTQMLRLPPKTVMEVECVACIYAHV